MNWPFLTLTARPVLAAACKRSVCRARKAGICKRSHTCAAGSAWLAHECPWAPAVRSRSLTAASVSSPLASPGPRNDLHEERLALSKDALNMSGNFIARPVPRAAGPCPGSAAGDSITHGPAIHSNGCPAARDCRWRRWSCHLLLAVQWYPRPYHFMKKGHDHHRQRRCVVGNAFQKGHSRLWPSEKYT